VAQLQNVVELATFIARAKAIMADAVRLSKALIAAYGDRR
jgi:hypothetical protein